MGSHSLNQNVFAERGGHNIPEADLMIAVKKATESILTMRAILVVGLLGAGCWYFIWKIALFIFATR